MKIVLFLFFLLINLVPDAGYSASRHSRKNKKFRELKTIKLKSKRKKRKHFGPDLKHITLESTFDEAPNNGVNNIERM